MRVQVNSDSTVSVDTTTKRFVKGEVERILENFDGKVTRVEVHLSDVNAGKSGPADKRCVVEVRPAGAKPRSTTATADALPTAIVQALRKMKRSLASFFGRQGRAAVGKTSAAPKAPVRKQATKATPAPTTRARVSEAVGSKATPRRKATAKRKPVAKVSAKVAAVETLASPASAPARRARKKPIFQARRRAWPTR